MMASYVQALLSVLHSPDPRMHHAEPRWQVAAVLANQTHPALLAYLKDALEHLELVKIDLLINTWIHRQRYAC
jgi:RNA-binding protein YhbY